MRTEWKAGDLVKSKEDHGRILKEGKIYVIRSITTESDEDFVQIKTAKGQSVDYYPWRFEKVEPSCVVKAKMDVVGFTHNKKYQVVSGVKTKDTLLTLFNDDGVLVTMGAFDFTYVSGGYSFAINDRVKCVDPGGNSVVKDKIYTFIKFKSGSSCGSFKDEATGKVYEVFPWRFEKVEEPKAEEKPKGFVVDELIMCIFDEDYAHVKKGKLYKVKSITMSGTRVNLNNDINEVYGYKVGCFISVSDFLGGDKVVCVDTHSSGGLLEAGKIYEVESVSHDDEDTFVTLTDATDSDDEWFANRFRLVERPEKVAPEPVSFSQGDRVTCIRSEGTTTLTEGNAYAISEVSGSSLKIYSDDGTHRFYSMDRFVPYVDQDVSTRINVGDSIECVRGCYAYTVGKVYEVKEVDPKTSDWVRITNDSNLLWWVTMEDFVECTPEPVDPSNPVDEFYTTASKHEAEDFKAGDKVYCVTTSASSLTRNKVYEILSVERGGVTVTNDKGNNWWYFPDRFEFVEQEPVCAYDPHTWEFEISNAAQIDDSEFIDSVSREFPLLFVEDPKSDFVFFYLHNYMQYKLGVLEDKEDVFGPVELSKRYDNCSVYCVKTEEWPPVLKFLKALKEAKWVGDGRGRRKIKVTQSNLK